MGLCYAVLCCACSCSSSRSKWQKQHGRTDSAFHDLSSKENALAAAMQEAATANRKVEHLASVKPLHQTVLVVL